MGITAVVAVAAVVSAAASIKQGQAENKRAKFQAAIQAQQAERERVVSSENERDFRRRQKMLLAERRAALGAAGVQGGTGSPLLAEADFVSEAELQALRIRQGGEIRASRLEQQSELTRRAGKSAQTQGLFRAGSSLLSGAGKAFG